MTNVNWWMQTCWNAGNPLAKESCPIVKELWQSWWCFQHSSLSSTHLSRQKTQGISTLDEDSADLFSITTCKTLPFLFALKNASLSFLKLLGVPEFTNHCTHMWQSENCFLTHSPCSSFKQSHWLILFLFHCFIFWHWPLINMVKHSKTTFCIEIKCCMWCESNKKTERMVCSHWFKISCSTPQTKILFLMFGWNRGRIMTLVFGLKIPCDWQSG